MSHNDDPVSIPDTRPGAHSAKNVRQAGAPNPHEDSGRNPMVDALLHHNALLGGMSGQGKGCGRADAALMDAALDWAVEVIAELDSENAALRAENAVLEGALADAAWEVNELRDAVADQPGPGTVWVMA